jgi:hypothetical protein
MIVAKNIRLLNNRSKRTTVPAISIVMPVSGTRKPLVSTRRGQIDLIPSMDWILTAPVWLTRTECARVPGSQKSLPVRTPILNQG